MAIGEIADTLRNGTVSGTDMWSGNRISIRLDTGFRSSTDFSGKSGQPRKRERCN